jgi:hypothetical protein
MLFITLETYTTRRNAPAAFVAQSSVLSSETSVNFCRTTQHNIPEDYNPHGHQREDFKSSYTSLCLRSFVKASCAKLVQYIVRITEE